MKIRDDMEAGNGGSFLYVNLTAIVPTKWDRVQGIFRKQYEPKIKQEARHLLGTKRNNSFIASSGQEWGWKTRK